MTLALITLCGLLCLIVFSLILWPLFESRVKEPEGLRSFRDYQSWHYERLRLLENLVDLDTDADLGKIKAADYQELKADLMSQLTAIYARIESWESKNETFQRIRAQADQRRGSVA